MGKQSFETQSSPTAEGARQQVHHSYIWLGSLRLASSLFVGIVFAFIAIFSKGNESYSRGSAFWNDSFLVIGITAACFLIIFILAIIIQVLSYKNIYYEMGEKEFSFYSGILNKKQVHIPYQRIQSVNQKATLFQRIFGVCTVHVDTAGGAVNKAVVVPYLQNSAAEYLRSELFARKQRILAGQERAFSAAAKTTAEQACATTSSSNSNILDAPAEVMADLRGVFGGMQAETLVAQYEYGLSNKELVFTGLSNNTGFIFMVLAALGSLVGLASQLFEVGIVQHFYQEGLALVARAFAGNLVWAIVVFAIVIMFVFWLASIIGTCISYGGFRARRYQNRIEVEHGLLQHQFHGVEIDRVQSVIIKQSFVRRLIGYCELSLAKIDAVTDNSQEQKQGVHQQGVVIHPFVKMTRVPEILSGLVPEFADVPTESIPLPPIALRRALIRRCLLKSFGFWFIVFVALCQIAINGIYAPVLGILDADALFVVNTGAFVAYALCLFFVVLEGVNAVMWYRGSSFAYNQQFLQISNGGFSRESVSLSRKKIQYGSTKTNPFQRAAQVATINVRTAAGIGGTTLRLLDAKQGDAEAWLEWVRPSGGGVK